MRTSFNYAKVLEYLPVRYSATPSQKTDRTTVYDFKNGICESRIFNSFVSIINGYVGNCKSDYVICFIPASSNAKTIRRYGNLSERLEKATGVKAYLSAIERTSDKESGYLNGKTGNPIEGISFNSNYFRGKKVILIDDVITRGRTFCMTANELLDRGATDVVGLFVAKTINPDWHRAYA